ncbi:hypothetical protein BpHYR1_033581 [Brachionus plicatilis]|uniref:CCHC-type domain-containing protein n=1 Tax=Brachionus plicatilis TaxID=10195 RepID=A0A3M7RIS3_BRAPC|nr:hypothetical protein BpHYR1_033581 [Brachionus plicatilis]
MKTFDTINNGVVKIKVEYNVKYHDAVLDFAGLHRISECQSLIQLCGMSAKCLGCKKFGHIRKDYPECQTCNKYGHEECNFANRTKIIPSDTVDDQEDCVDDPDDMDTNAANKTTTQGGQSINLNESVLMAPTEMPFWTETDAENFKVPVSGSTKPSSTSAASSEVEITVSLPPTFKLMTTDSKILNTKNQQASTLQIKQEQIDAEAAKKLKNKVTADKRKATIKKNAIAKMVSEQVASNKKTSKEHTSAEFGRGQKSYFGAFLYTQNFLGKESCRLGAGLFK